MNSKPAMTNGKNQMPICLAMRRLMPKYNPMYKNSITMPKSMRSLILVGICRKTIQKSEKRERRNPKNSPVLKCIDWFVFSIAKNNGTRPNQAKKCSPKGWKERETNKADIRIKMSLIFVWLSPKKNNDHPLQFMLQSKV